MAKVLSKSFPAQSMLHSHATAANILKFALLATRGITQDEYSGKDAHNLATLMAALKQNQNTGGAEHWSLSGLGTQAPPVPTLELSHDRLSWLTNSFHSTRYAPFPPSGTSIMPSSKFSVDDADNAYDIASYLVEWARAMLPFDSREFSNSSHRNEEEDVAASAAYAAAEARARVAEQEVERLNVELEQLRGSAGQSAERDRMVLEEEKEVQTLMATYLPSGH